ncbi:MAG TPA: uroporphyrinogen-III synthase [Burkholderiaceae bacterium]
MSGMQLLVTRPQPQADEWAAALRAHGVAAHALPLLQIVPASDPAAAAAWAALPDHSLVVFVSPGCVASFFAQRPPAGAWPTVTQAAATGPGTSLALREAGVPAAAIVEPPRDAEQFDSEALWRVLATRSWRGRRVLIVRGDGGRDWLADRLREQGAEVAFVQAYRRTLPSLSAPQRALLAAALAAPAHHCWLFSSSQAVAHLGQLAPQSDWSSGCAMATHPRIAQTLRAAGFGTVWPVRPTLDAVLDVWRRSLQSMPAPDQRP